MFGSDDLDVRKRYALQMLAQGQESGPVKHPLAAVARALQGAMGGYMAGQARAEDEAQGAAMFSGLPGLGGGAAPSTPPSGPGPVSMPQNGVSSPLAGNYGDAIAKIESGGSYDKLGPHTKGDRAYGKYQVMGNNIPQWTTAALGQPMSPQQFLSSPEAQEAVFKHRFGGYVDKYGPEGAAKAWFAGEKGMNNPNARDVLGTTVDSYAKKFSASLGPQTASLSGGFPQSPPQAAPQQPPGQQVAQAQPGRTQTQIPPDVAQTIKNLGANPKTRAQAWQLYLQYAKPTESFSDGVDANGTRFQRNSLTGEVKADPRNVDKYEQGVDENGVPFQKNTKTGKIESDPRRDVAVNEVEYARKNWKQLGFPDPVATDANSTEFWRTYNAKRLGGPGTNVTVDNRGEGEFSKEGAKLTAKRYDDIIQEGPKAKQMLSDVQTLQTLGGIIGTGKEAELKAKLGPWAKAIGIDVDGLGEIQAYEAIVNRIAPTLRVPGSGAQSDFELRNFLKQLPQIGNTPEGNALISRTVEGLAKNKMDAAEIADQALNREITRKEAAKMLRELPDPMQEYRDHVKKTGTKSEPAKTQQPATADGWIDKGGGVKIREKR